MCVLRRYIYEDVQPSVGYINTPDKQMHVECIPLLFYLMVQTCPRTKPYNNIDYIWKCSGKIKISILHYW